VQQQQGEQCGRVRGECGNVVLPVESVEHVVQLRDVVRRALDEQFVAEQVNAGARESA
jgi:hypothetical protein